MNTSLYTVVLAIVLLGSWAASGIALQLLARYNVFSYPVTRSSHIRPIPQGGGIAVVGMVAIGWTAIGVIGIENWPSLAVILAGTLSLALVSWFDDVGGLPISIRLLSQAITVAVVMFLVPLETVTNGLIPFPLECFLIAMLWIWIINLFNFMDGIDGIAGVETLCIGFGITIVSIIADVGIPLIFPTAIVCLSIIGFLPWNWSPAKLFLGDVGSVPIGFILGWLLLELAGEGLWVAAVALPGYYVADTTITLCRRAIGGELVWKSHRKHFYQLAVIGKLTHGQASRAVAVTGIWLIGCAILSTICHACTLVSLAAAVSGVIGLLWYFHRNSHPIVPSA